MNVFTLNKCGGIGKSMLSAQISSFLMPTGAEKFLIDGVNEGDDKQATLVPPERFPVLAAKMISAGPEEHHWVDLGASQYQGIVMDRLPDMSMFVSLIDYWLVPAISDGRHAEDTISTARDLIELGVDPSRIIVALNRAGRAENIGYDFEYVIQESIKLGVTLLPGAVADRPIFQALKGSGRTVFDVEASLKGRNMQQERRAAGSDKELLLKIAEEITLGDAANRAAQNLRAVFMASPIYKVTHGA